MSYEIFKLNDRPSSALVIKVLAQCDFAHNRVRVIKSLNQGRLVYVLQKYSQSTQKWEDYNRTNVLNKSLSFLHFINEIETIRVDDGELLMQTSNRFLLRDKYSLNICRLATEDDLEYIEDEEVLITIESYDLDDQSQALKRLLYFHT